MISESNPLGNGRPRGSSGRASKVSGIRSKLRGGRLDCDDEVKYAPGQTFDENIKEALKNLVAKSGVTKAKKIAYLNSLCKIWSTREVKKEEVIGLRLKEVLLCLRIPLTHESAEVRATTLRTVRALTTSEEDVLDLIRVNIGHLITRCLDIELDNKVERIHALRLARKLMFLSPIHFPKSIARCLISIAESSEQEDDKLVNICLGILCELSVFNSEVFIDCNGVRVFAQTLLDCTMPRISESIIGSLLHLHDHPFTRNLAKMQLDLVVAPFTEFRYIHNDPDTNLNKLAIQNDDKQHRFQCSRYAILSLMRSWVGIIHLTNPTQGRGRTSPLKSLVETLYFSNEDVRTQIIGIFYDLLGLTVPKETSSLTEALHSTSPSYFKDSWKLAEGFVAAEGMAILPNILKSRPNLLETHRSLLLYCLLKTEFSQALVRVIITADRQLSFQATILLGEYLFLIHLILPRELNATSHCLPSLLSEVSSSDLIRSNRASEAVQALLNLHVMKKQGPHANSLFLEEIMVTAGHLPGQNFIGERVNSPKWSEIFRKTNNDRTALAIQESKVLETKDAAAWDWVLIEAVFKWPGDAFSLLDSPENKMFLKKIVDFFKPTNNKFAKLELGNKISKQVAKIGCYVIDFLLKNKATEAQKSFDTLLNDIKNQIIILISSNSAHDCLFSPTRIASTACQYYFLFFGRLSKSPDGRRVLDNLNILQSFYELLSMRSDMYLKLVITCLDYTTVEWGSRNLLGKACREGPETLRIYATKFLGVLIRSRSPNIAQWGIDLLVNQLFDKSKVIPWIALQILDEACDDKMNLEAVVCSLSPKYPLQNYLDIHGVFLLVHFISSANGFKFLSQTELLKKQLNLWANEYNTRYVSVVEQMLNDGFTRHQHNEERAYGRRSHEAHLVHDSFIPPHLYGHLAKNADGLKMLFKEKALQNMIFLLNDIEPDMIIPAEKMQHVKAAIWAISHVSASAEGVAWTSQEGALHSIVSLAEKSSHFSIRGTAFYALGLVAMTPLGSKILIQHGWCSLKYGKEEKWPVAEDLFLSQLNHLQAMDSEDSHLYYSEEEDIDSEVSGSRDTADFLDYSRTLDDSQSSQSSSLSARKRLSQVFRSFSVSAGRERRRLSLKLTKGMLPRRQHSEENAAMTVNDSVMSSSPKLISTIGDKDDIQCSSSSIAEDKIITKVDEEVTTKNEDEFFTVSADLDALAAAGIDKVDENKKHESFTDSTSGISSEGSLQMPRTGFSSVIDQSQPKLSPIASATSISTMLKSPTITKPVNDKDHPHRDASRYRHVTRSGQRAFSESEAGNVTINSSAAQIHISTSSVSSSISSWTENPGYLTLKSIHNRKRPPLMLEEPTDPNDKKNDSPMMSAMRTGRSNTWSRKTRSLDYRLTRVARAYVHLPHRESKQKNMNLRPVQEEKGVVGGPEPMYWGITLPLSLEKFFSIELPPKPVGSDESLEFGEIAHSTSCPSPLKGRDVQIVGDWLKSQHQHPDVLSKFHGLELHTSSNCLACFRLQPNSNILCDPVSSSRHRSGSLSYARHPASSSGVASASREESETSRSVSGHASPFLLRSVRKSSLIESDDSFGGGSTQSLKSDSESRTVTNTVVEKILMQKEVLKLVGSMNATIGVKSFEQGLLKLKQRRPHIFNDLCLYSEICLLLTKYSYRLSARRFIQELFMGLQYEELYHEPYRILGLEDSPSHLSQLEEINSDENLYAAANQELESTVME